jgi:hypothetical protein
MNQGDSQRHMRMVAARAAVVSAKEVASYARPNRRFFAACYGKPFNGVDITAAMDVGYSGRGFGDAGD